jgi:hypothetical protein
MRVALLAVAVFGLAACSVSFDPNGQPCDAQGGCLSGYTCDATKHCQLVSGSTSGSSGTTGSTGGACGGTICAAGQKCASDGGAPKCVARTGSGVLCTANTDCGSAGVCLHPPGGGTGLCTQLCASGADAGCPLGASCTAVTGARGNPFRVCLDSPPPLSCTSSRDCGADAGLACLPFDAPAFGSPIDDDLPLLWCDRALDGGSAIGGSCNASGGCSSGVCAASRPIGICAALCGPGTCAPGLSCAGVRSVGANRILQACVGAATSCQACNGSANDPCGPDAPDCDLISSRCVLDCNTSLVDACGTGRACLTNSSSVYCAVDAGVCP